MHNLNQNLLENQELLSQLQNHVTSQVYRTLLEKSWLRAWLQQPRIKNLERINQDL
jgi:hypothetical protein